MAQPSTPRASGAVGAQALPLPGADAFAPLLEHSLNGFVVLNAEGTYVWVSASMCNLLECTKEQLLGRSMHSCCYADDRPSLLALFNAARTAAAADRPSEAYVRVRHASGSMAPHDFTPIELKACSDGTFLYCVALDARMPARLEGLLPEFLLATSHDLRTPCASIQAASAMLLTFPEVADDSEACSLLRCIDAACTVLTCVISNVLSMCLLQRHGHITLGTPRSFDPRATVSRAVEVICDFDGVPPRVAWAPDNAAEPLSALPTTALGDEGALEAALYNVLIAAVRLGAWQSVQPQVLLQVAAEPLETIAFTVTAERATSPPGPPGSDVPSDAFVLVVRAETPGRALSDDECDSLLAPFGMVPADKGGGTGLSLFVARGIALAMGGDLVVESGRTEGSLITLRLPLRVPDPYLLRHLATAKAAHSPAAAAAGVQVAAPPPPETALREESRPPERSGAAAMQPETPREAGDAAAGAATHVKRERSAPQTLLNEVEMSSRMFECLLTNCDDVFAICRVVPQRPGDPDSPLWSRCEYISPSVAWRLSFPQQSVLGQDLVDVCHPEDRTAFRSAVMAAYKGHAPQGRRLLIMHRSMTATGEFIWCHSAGMCAGDLIFLVCRDVRTRKSVEVALRAFTLATSHDLREPCNAILVSLAVLERRACMVPSHEHASAGGRDLLSRSLDAAHLEPAELVAVIRSSCGLLLGIVGNLLSAPQLQAMSDLTLNKDIFSPSAVVHDVLQAVRLGSALATGLEAEPGDPLPPLVEGDACRVAQVVQNLCTNAIKARRLSDEASAAAKLAPPAVPVRVSAAMEPADAHPPAPAPAAADRPWLVIRVTDGGRGMSAADAAACFTAGVASSAKQGGGTGLGLSLSQASAQLMGGSLSVQSVLGEGSTFTLRVPVRVLSEDEVAAVQAQEAAAAAAAEAERAERSAAEAEAHEDKCARLPLRERPLHRRALHVLVADDHPLNLRLLTRLLQLHDFTVTAVPDGGAALAALMSSHGPRGGTAAAGGSGGVSAAAPPAGAGAPFDLAILDMQMPVMSGPDVAVAFRAWEAQQAQQSGVYTRLPLIALTANAMEEHAAQCEAAGMDLFVVKPLRDAAIPALRAHAAAHAEQRAVDMDARAATREAAAAAAAAAAGAVTAHAVLGPAGLPAPRSRFDTPDEKK